MKTINLSQGKVALVDDEDFDRLNSFKWSADKVYGNREVFYARRNERTRLTTKHTGKRMHREIMGITDRRILVDHVDGDGLNNQKYNLRVCTKAQNQYNAQKTKSATSKYKGVMWDKNKILWMAKISINNKTSYIGRYKTEIEAASAYNKVALKIRGEFALLNTI